MVPGRQLPGLGEQGLRLGIIGSQRGSPQQFLHPAGLTGELDALAGLRQDPGVPLAEQLKVHPQRRQRELTPHPLALCAPGRLHPRPDLRRHALQQLAVLVGFPALLLGLLPDRLGPPAAFTALGVGAVFLLLAFAFFGGCPGGIPRLMLPPVTTEGGAQPLPGLAARSTAVLARSATPARIGGRQVHAAAQTRTPHVTKPSCWPQSRFRDGLMAGTARVATDATAGSLTDISPR